MTTIDNLAHMDGKSKWYQASQVIGRMVLTGMIFVTPLLAYKSCQTYELKDVNVESKKSYTVESTGFNFDGFAEDKYHDISEITVSGYKGCFRGKELDSIKQGDYLEKIVFKNNLFSDCEEVIDIIK